jgi:hypothetical protein
MKWLHEPEAKNSTACKILFENELSSHKDCNSTPE